MRVQIARIATRTSTSFALEARRRSRSAAPFAFPRKLSALRLGAAVAPRLVLAAAALAFAACELHQGQVYPAGGAPRFEATRTCESREASTTSPLRVIVLDSSKVPVADATVRIGEAGGAGEGALVRTNAKGEAEVDVAAGRWQIDVTASALAPARYVLDLPAGQACVVRITLQRGEDVFPF